MNRNKQVFFCIVTGFLTILLNCTGKYKPVNKFLTKLPLDLRLQENQAQKYNVISKINMCDIYGTTNRNVLMIAEYTRALPDSSVRWNNVRIASGQNTEMPVPKGNSLKCMENFSYKVSGDNIVQDEFYENIPAQLKDLIFMLVTDAVTTEAMAWMYFDSLTLNQAYQPAMFEDFDVSLRNSGVLKMKGLTLKWSGISEFNDEICALIQYESFSNPVEINTNSKNIKGRSLYWGSVWISLEDKQIEYAVMKEDVIFDYLNTDQNILNMQREVEFKKML